MLANLSAASPFASNYPPLALSGCLLLLGDPSELLGVLLELGAVDLEGLVLGQVSTALEEGSNEAHPASVGLVEALVVVVSGVLSGLLVDGLTIMEDDQGSLDPSLVGGKLLTDGGDKVLELDRLSALRAAHVLTVAFRELEDNQPSNPRKGVIRDIRTAYLSARIYFNYLDVVDEEITSGVDLGVNLVEARTQHTETRFLEREGVRDHR